MVVVNKYLSIHTYRRAPHCDEEIGGGERDDKRWIEVLTARLHGGYTTMYDDSHVYVCMACTAHAQIAFLWEAIMDRSSSPQRRVTLTAEYCIR